MDARPYRRRATGELAIDPALHELVVHSGALMDRLICGRSTPIPEVPPPRPRQVTPLHDRGGDGGGEGGG